MCVFRSMSEQDIMMVLELEKNLFIDPWPMESFYCDLFGNEKAFSFVMEKNNEIIGYIMGWYIEPEIHISNMAVKKNYQRQGIGAKLLANLFNYYNEYTDCILEVRESNDSAKNLYKKFGFREIYRRKSYYHNGETALIMSKHK